MGARGARYHVGTHLGFNLQNLELIRKVLVSTPRGLGEVLGRPFEWDMGSKVPWAGPWVWVGPRVGSGTGQVEYQEAPGHHEGPKEATEGSWGSWLRSSQVEGSMGP